MDEEGKIQKYQQLEASLITARYAWTVAVSNGDEDLIARTGYEIRPFCAWHDLWTATYENGKQERLSLLPAPWRGFVMAFREAQEASRKDTRQNDSCYSPCYLVCRSVRRSPSLGESVRSTLLQNKQELLCEVQGFLAEGLGLGLAHLQERLQKEIENLRAGRSK